MTIMREAGGKGRAVVECVQGFALGELQLLMESVDLLPIFQDFLFFFGEVGSLGD